MLSLLLAVGSDCVGDVRVVPAGAEPASHPPLVVTKDWSRTDFVDLFSASVAIGGERVERIALPGVQGKVSAAMISFPVEGAQASHLLKLAPEGYPRLVENEAFVMRFARAAGLAVADTAIVTDAVGRTGLLVTRFDRLRREGRLHRLAQEDAAQFCGRYPADKYLLTLNQVALAVRELTAAPAVAIRDLVRLVAFSYLVANGDLHAKNISLRTRPDGLTELAPAYDLLADLPYTGDLHQALQLDGRDLHLTRNALTEFAGRFDVRSKAVHATLDRICDIAPAWIARVPEIGLDERAAAHLGRTMTQRIAELGG